MNGYIEDLNKKCTHKVESYEDDLAVQAMPSSAGMLEGIECDFAEGIADMVFAEQTSLGFSPLGRSLHLRQMSSRGLLCL